MTKLLDRMLGLAVREVPASAMCPVDTWTEHYVKCTPGIYNETCVRTCTIHNNCSETCSAWSGCRCIAGDEKKACWSIY